MHKILSESKREFFLVDDDDYEQKNNSQFVLK